MAIQQPLPGFLPGDERRAALPDRLAALVEHDAVLSRRRHVLGLTRQVNPQPLHQFKLFGGGEFVQRNIDAHESASEG